MNNKLVLGTVQFGCQYGINSAGRPDEKTVLEIQPDQRTPLLLMEMQNIF